MSSGGEAGIGSSWKCSGVSTPGNPCTAFPSNVDEVELKGEELQLTALDSADQDKLVFDSLLHCVL